MKRTIAALLLTATAPVWAQCPYPLDGTQADLDATPVTQGWKQATVYNGQSIDVTITPAESLHTAYGALSHAGLVAMQQAAALNVPMGDYVLPESGTVHIRMQVNSFPWGTFTGSNSAAALFVSVLSGNHAALNPLPKDAFQLNVALLNSRSQPSSHNLWINGQAITGAQVGTLNRYDPLPLPFPGDIVGLWINTESREVGLSIRITAVDPNLPPPGEYDLEALRDNQGQPFLLPGGVTSVALGLGALVSQVDATDPLQGAHLGATLLTDHCGSSGPQPLKLPNGRLFKGKGNPPGLLKRQN